MKPKLSPYPEYHESKLSWLGIVPTHWAERRAKYFFREVDERSETGKEELLSVSHMTGVTLRSQKNVTMFMAESNAGHKICRPGDVVINTMWAWMAALGVAKHTGLVSPSYGVYRPTRNDQLLPGYIDHLLRSQPYASEYFCRSTGIRTSRLRLYPDRFLDIPVLCPSVEEQWAILSFIRNIDHQVRTLIQAKRRLIELLEEQKRTVVEKVITGGIDPKTRLKASGVDWLGDVPGHWKVASLRFRYDQCLGKMVDAKKATGKHLIPYLRNFDVRWDSINTQDLPLIDIMPHERERFTVKVGDLLVCEGRHLGRCAFWAGEIAVCGFQKALHRLRPLNPATDNPRFLFYCLYLAHIKDAFDASSTDNSIPHLTGEMLRAHKFPFPPLEEQTAIATYLDDKLAVIKKAMTSVQAEVSLVLEFRSRLIADIVTGKLDVREAAERLPLSAEQEVCDDDSLGLSALDPEDTDGLADSPELLSVITDEG